MGTMQIVFLFDLNAFDDLSKHREVLSKRLLYIRLACLRLLTEFSSKTSNFRWGFKFFDSCGSVTQTMCKFSFPDFSLEAFETLESEICVRYERRESYSQAIAESSRNNINLSNDSANNLKSEKHPIAPVKILQMALTQILNEFQWEYMDMWSPSSKKFKDSALSMGERNILVYFGDFSDNGDKLLKYFGVDCLPTKAKLRNIILPPTLREKLLDKANIHWIWLNVSQEQKFMNTTESRTLSVLSQTLQSVRGSLIPLSLLSQPLYHMKLLTYSEDTSLKSVMSPTSNLYNGLNNSLLPFSTIIRQSLYHPFYLSTNANSKCNLSFVHNGMQIPIQVIKILKQWKYNCSKEDCGVTEKYQNSVKSKLLDITTIKWSSFTIQALVSKDVKYVAVETLLCLPSDVETDISVAERFVGLNRTLCLKEIKLVLTCVTDSGLEMPGLLTPLSNEAAVIALLDPLVHLMHEPNIKIFDRNSLNDANGEFENASKDIQSFRTEIKTHSDNSPVNCTNDPKMKQFQMESLEVWFKPTSAISSFASFIQSKSSKYSVCHAYSSKIDSFHKLLQQSVKNKDNSHDESSKENVPLTSGVEIHTECPSNESNELFTDLTVDELLTASKEIYTSALEPNTCAIECAKKIVRRVSSYYKKHGDLSFEENVQKFMKDNFFMTVRRISEKYEMLQSEDDINHKIKECQVQVLLTLEIEALTLPPDKSNCVNSVTALLRMMSFYSGALQLNKLLCDSLRDYYSHNLYDVLVEIGDELDMPIFGETESSDSPDFLSSELMDTELLGSAISSSNMSARSSSSVCSRKDNNRKLVRHRSDISDSTRSRQVLLPRTSPKKKRAKLSAQKKAMRFSPRLASRKIDKPTKIKEEKPRNVRRNLFPKDKTAQTPKKIKKNHVLKTKFVAETPSHKQNHSALQRIKSFVEKQSTQDSPKEIAESPKIIKNAKNDSNKELLQRFGKFREGTLKPPKESSVQKESSPFKHTQYTPESKRRLSLKLFSKLLSSPTARMGIKKCTKRLFDQVSPHKSGEIHKKLKTIEESTDAEK